ncbi:MAG: NYN domain-containing protein [Woeseiaceae bacterium]|nr:NYN domain-containing protein [Woeseiaceae bacterium]
MKDRALLEADKDLEKVGIFVDVQNIYYTCRQAYQGNFDYNKFWDEVTKGRNVVCAHAYATDRGDTKQIQFQNILRAIGFDVQLKAVLKRRDGTAKADWDVGIALDVFEAAHQCDTIVLASGDGDFGILLDRIRDRFKTQSEVYGVRALTSSQLIGPASRFVPIDEKLILK